VQVENGAVALPRPVAEPLAPPRLADPLVNRGRTDSGDFMMRVGAHKPALAKPRVAVTGETPPGPESNELSCCLSIRCPVPPAYYPTSIASCPPMRLRLAAACSD
jgi:hypothetical protein